MGPPEHHEGRLLQDVLRPSEDDQPWEGHIRQELLLGHDEALRLPGPLERQVHLGSGPGHGLQFGRRAPSVHVQVRAVGGAGTLRQVAVQRLSQLDQVGERGRFQMVPGECGCVRPQPRFAEGAVAQHLQALAGAPDLERQSARLQHEQGEGPLGRLPRRCHPHGVQHELGAGAGQAAQERHGRYHRHCGLRRWPLPRAAAGLIVCLPEADNADPRG
mmetsp:Transcript_6245/g.14230  ORF Transcript_6245/g.14230 Transcript_6245/m.14230 type:complete len:217 (-) Transcript_6245:546-1196(-)